MWASSETVLGLPFDAPPPYAPLDEAYPGRPESAYSLAKLVSETMAEQFCRWDPGMKIFGLRFSNVMEPEGLCRHPLVRRRSRAAALEPVELHRRARRGPSRPPRDRVEPQGARRSSSSPTTTPSWRDRARSSWPRRFPDVPLKAEVRGNEALMSSGKARRLLGFRPQHGWRTGTPDR